VNNIFINVFVNGMNFEIKWHDFGTYMKLDVFQNSKILGSKKFPIATDRGDGVVTHAIKSILKDKENGSRN